jgi:hypothetical protein
VRPCAEGGTRYLVPDNIASFFSNRFVRFGPVLRCFGSLVRNRAAFDSVSVRLAASAFRPEDVRSVSAVCPGFARLLSGL